MSEIDYLVSEAREILLDRENLEEGSDCPCCGQYVKSYRRNISGTIASLLIAAYQKYGLKSFRPIDEFGKNSPDFVKLRYWDLLKEVDPEAYRDDGSNRTGKWRLTLGALQFVRGSSTRPKYAVIYNNKFLRFEGEPVTIRDCLGKKFDYEELMGRHMRVRN